MALRTWTTKRVAIAMLSLAIGIAPFGAGHADIRGGLVSGYSDSFDYPNVNLTSTAPLDPFVWQTYPVNSIGNPVPNVWVVGSVQSTSLTSLGGEVKALRQRTTGAGASEPIAFVRNGNWQNMVVQVRAAFEGASQNSGLGILFRSPVDPVSGLADRNNFYLFTAVNSVPSTNPNAFFTGRGFALFKRVGGAYYLATKADSYLNFVGSNGANETHTYKVVMSGSHIMCYVDGRLVIEVNDTPGDDVSGIFAMPGPMIANGTVGVRTSNTRAWFDDFIVMGDGPRAYEGRAAAVTTFGQIGSGATGIVVQQTAGDTDFQYHDHDFPTGTSTEGTVLSPTAPGNGFAGGALVRTQGKDGVASSEATLLGVSGLVSQTMPDGSSVEVSLVSDSIAAKATASCDATTTNVTLVNFTYLIVVRNQQGIPLLFEGKNTQLNPPPNTILADPTTSGGYIQITLNYQKVTDDPKRADVAAIRVDFVQRRQLVQSGGSSIYDTGLTTASVQLANVVAGRFCTPFI